MIEFCTPAIPTAATKDKESEMFVSGLRYVDDVNVDAILFSTPKKAVVINELRHKAINYDDEYSEAVKLAELLRCPVLVLPHGTALRFRAGA